MAKNKGLTPHRKKELRNPRVKHRNKYRKATIRRKGAVSIIYKNLFDFVLVLSMNRLKIIRSPAIFNHWLKLTFFNICIGTFKSNNLLRLSHL